MLSFGTSLTTLCLTLGAFALAGGNPSDLITKLDHRTSPVTTQHLPVHNGEDGRMYMYVNINGNDVRVIVDTAASHSVLSARDAKLASIETHGATKIITAGGQSEAKFGVANSIQVVESEILNHRILIVEGLPVSILGIDVLKRMNGYYISF